MKSKFRASLQQEGNADSPPCHLRKHQSFFWDLYFRIELSWAKSLWFYKLCSPKSKKSLLKPWQSTINWTVFPIAKATVPQNVVQTYHYNFCTSQSIFGIITPKTTWCVSRGGFSWVFWLSTSPMGPITCHFIITYLNLPCRGQIM